MFTVILSAGPSAEALARTISAMVPAIAQGAVRDGWIVDPREDAASSRIADAAGCTLVGGERQQALARAIGSAQSDWLLFAGAGAVPEHGWWEDAVEFAGRAGPGQAALFAWRDPRYGVAGRMAELGKALRNTLRIGLSVEQGMLIRREAFSASRPVHLPPAGTRIVTLRIRSTVYR